MDFIEPLPASTSSDSILVVVNWFSKQAIFILTDVTCTSADLAQLFIVTCFLSMVFRAMSLVTVN